MNLLGPTILFCSLASFMHVFLEMDSIQIFIPPSYLNHPGVILLRIAVQGMALLDWVVTVAQTHLVLITLILHTKSIFVELAVLKRKVSAKINEQSGSSKKGQKCKSRIFTGMDDMQLYSLANYFFTVVNQNLSFSVVFILGPGLALDVSTNYMVLQMYEGFPIYLYVVACLMGTVGLTIMAYELPKAGETYETSCELLHGWKEKCPSRRTLRNKRVMSFRPIGYTSGGWFTFKRDTVTTVAEQLMDYTINSILTF
jgi:hypothetical protein